MEIDQDLAEKMRLLAAREVEVAREKEDLKFAAEQELAQLDTHIEEVRTNLNNLEDRREDLARFLGRSSYSDGLRLAHGALKELCFEALASNQEPMRSSEIKEWIERHHPDVRTASVPATLSRQAEYGTLVRDSQGRYRLR